MPDPFETLRRRDPEEVPVNRLPADEVRRRGDARRRRRTTLQGAAATLAVAAVVGGVALGTGVVDRGAPSPDPATQGPSPDPSPTRAAEPTPTRVADPDAVTAVPAGFPLADGYPAVTGVDEELQGPAPDVPAFGEVTACGETLERVPPVERLAATYSQPEDFRARELTTYGSESDALDELAGVVRLFEGCPRESFDGGPDAVVEVEPGGLGSSSYTIVRRYETDGSPVPGIEVVVAVQVGNALLLSSESNEGGASPQGVRQSVRRGEGAVGGVVQAMCVFAPDGCGDTHTPGLLAQADFEHLTGFRTTWQRSGDAFSSDDCRETIPATLLARGATAEVYEGRSDEDVLNARGITTFTEFADAAAARVAYDDAAGDLARCADAQLAVVERGSMMWRMFSSPAPEVCTECGTVWLHAVGLSLAGNRVVAVNLSWIGDLETVVGAEDPPPMSAVMGVATEVAVQEGGG